MSAIERKRRYRDRVRRGIQIVAVEVDQNMVERLLQLRLITVEEMADKDRLAAAIEVLGRHAATIGR